LKQFLSIGLFLLCVFQSNAQQFNYSKFWVALKDKNNSPYSINNPSEYLSDRAIERRQRYNIAIDERDIPVNEEYVSFIQGTGATILTRSKWFNAVTIQLSDTTILETIRQFSFVKSVEPVFGTRIQQEEIIYKEAIVKTEDYYPDDLYGSGLNQIEQPKGNYLHHNGFRGKGIVIAVFDSGFKNVNNIDAFNSLFNNEQLLGTYDFVDGNESVFEETSDGHGTNVLSTIASNLPGQFVGTAPDASYWLLRTEDAPTEFRIEEDNWIAAAEFADSVGADVINSSLGYSDFDDPAMTYIYADMNGKTARISRGATIAASKGMILVNSAGNSGNNSWRYITAPADADSILAVGAVDSLGNVVGFSSRGPSSDGRVKPDVMAQGYLTTIVTTGGQIAKSNGTSFSSPVMAGLVACFWQAHREKNNIEIMHLIRQSASFSMSPNDSMGYGIPNFKSIHDMLMREKGLMYQQENLPLVYPNPFSNHLDVMFYTNGGDVYEVLLYDNVGKLHYSEKRYIDSGYYANFKITGLDGLNNGVYYIRIRSHEVNETIRVAKF